jgi:hypothetical protein
MVDGGIWLVPIGACKLRYGPYQGCPATALEARERPGGAVVLALLLRHWEFAGTDQEIAHEIYAVDAVLEFAQSDGRFVGVENSKPLREKYPEPFGAPHCVRPRRGDLWVVENLINYDGRPWQPTVNILEFRGEKVVRDPSTSLRRGRRLTGAHRGEPRTEPTVGAGCAYAVARSRRIRTSRCSSSPNMKTCWSNSSYPRWR